MKRCFTSLEESCIVAVVADGAGSASHSEQGAEIACEIFASTAIHKLLLGESPSDTEFATSILARVREGIDKRAVDANLASREFATTLLAVVSTPRETLFFQLGDGAIVVLREDIYDLVFWPQCGEYVNQAHFVTDQNAFTKLRTKLEKASVDEFALLTDGLQPVALHYATQAAHSPFFVPLFASLRREPTGPAHRLVAPCEQWLASPALLERTDDDKTLVLVTRISEEPSSISLAADPMRASR